MISSSDDIFRKALSLHKAGQINDAEALYKDVLKYTPRHNYALLMLGIIAKEKGDFEMAISFVQEALKIQAVPGIYLETAILLENVNKEGEALHNYDKAVEQEPQRPDAFFHKGNLLLRMGLFEESRICFDKALSLKPGDIEILSSLGLVLIATGKAEQAVSLFRELISRKPDQFNLHANLAVALLVLGKFDEGFNEYRWRWDLPAYKNAFSAPLWRGENISGKTLLVHGEHGLGDTIQFCRYIPLIKDQNAQIVFRVPQSLLRLMKSLATDAHVISSQAPCPHFDFHCSMMDLPGIFSPSGASIPATIPYLQADAADLLQWEKKIPHGEKNVKVGLAWAGDPHLASRELRAKDKRRSIKPELFAPLMRLPGFTFYSLQKDGPLAPPDLPIINLMDKCHDFADTAAFIMQLDLVVSVDTSVAHLAGALGKPVWLLNRYDTCWRWLYDREDSPWYPHMRIFRQKQSRKWEEVIERVKEALEARIF